MSNPVIANNSPAKVALEQGKKYYFCMCGRSSKQPFCDGSHKDTSFEPVAFTAEKTETVYLCGCKRTGSQPFCDGSHKEL